MSHSDGELRFIGQLLQLLLPQVISSDGSWRWVLLHSRGIKVKPDRDTEVIPALPNMAALLGS